MRVNANQQTTDDQFQVKACPEMSTYCCALIPFYAACIAICSIPRALDCYNKISSLRSSLSAEEYSKISSKDIACFRYRRDARTPNCDEVYNIFAISIAVTVIGAVCTCLNHAYLNSKKISQIKNHTD